MTCISNPKVYPLDFPIESFDLKNPLPGDPVVGVEEVLSSLEAIQVQARDTALRQANTRRISGHQSIQNQNRLTSAVNKPLSFAEVGKRRVPAQGVQGTVAHLAGGRNYQKALLDMVAFYFGNESLARTGLLLSEGTRSYVGTCSNNAAGYYVGGIQVDLNALTGVDRLSFDKPTIGKISTAALSSGRLGAAGIGNATQGVFLGGSAWHVGLRIAEQLLYSTENMSLLGDKLNVARVAAHNGTSTPTNGYVYGGVNHWAEMVLPGSRLFTVEGYNYGTQLCTTLGGTLIVSHLAHAAFGSTLKGYVAGGLAASAPGAPATDVISMLNYDTLNVSTLGETLVEPTICCDGANSSAAGYTLGGEKEVFTALAKANKLLFASDSVYSIGTTLPGVYSDRGCVCDYSPSI